MQTIDSLKKQFEEEGQGHIFAGWDKLNDEQRRELADDCAKVDFAWLDARRRECLDSETTVRQKLGARLQPAPVEALPSTPEQADQRRKALAYGEDLLRAGKAAAFLVAGGQGSRLGFNGPKGCYPLGPISGKTLFQWHAEQIRARSRRYGRAIPWYIMTSCDNFADTTAYFRENDFLGLPERDVFFFIQDMVPTIDRDGKLLLAAPSRLAMNPNGHGGAVSGLYKSGACDDMIKRGVEYIGSFQVDNPLITICDPLFLGFHALAGAEMSSKVLRKVAAEEKIGSVGLLDGKPVVVEYSDLDDSAMRATDQNGQLLFWAGSIGLHVLNVDFVKRIGGLDALPWHQAIKNVAYFDGKEIVKPKDKNAVKFETFIFDAIPLSAKSVNLEVKREHEFAPVKNATGVDSAESCRALMTGYFGEWLEDCGVKMPAGNDVEIEISPLYSLDGEELKSKVKPGGVKIEKRFLLA